MKNNEVNIKKFAPDWRLHCNEAYEFANEVNGKVFIKYDEWGAPIEYTVEWRS